MKTEYISDGAELDAEFAQQVEIIERHKALLFAAGYWLNRKI